MADEIRLSPSIAVRQEYNDNIIYTTDEAKKDSYTTVSPGLTFLEKTERLQIDLSGRADRRLYQKYSDLNSTDQFYDGTARYLISERLSVTGMASYSKDSRPDRDLETTGLAFTGVTRYRQNYGFSSTYALSEILASTFSCSYLNDTYDDPRFVDMESYVFNAGLAHDLSYFMQKTQGRVNLGYARYSVPDLRVDNFELTAGINRALDEKWNLLLDAGLRYTRSRYAYTEFMPIPPFLISGYESNEDWGGVGQLALTYTGLKTIGEVKVNHDIMPASGRSGATERTSFIVSVTMKLSNEFRCILNGGYFINKSRAGQYSLQEIDEDSVWINPGIVYEYSKDIRFDLSYTYNTTRYNESRTEASRNLFQLTFKIKHDLFD